MAEYGDLRQYVLIVLVLSVFLISMSTFIDETTSNYGITEDAGLTEGTTYYGNMSSTLDDIQGDLDTTVEGDFGEDNLLVASWKMIKRVYKSTESMLGLFSGFGNTLGLDSDLINGFYAILTAIIIFAIIGVVTRTKAP